MSAVGRLSAPASRPMATASVVARASFAACARTVVAPDDQTGPRIEARVSAGVVTSASTIDPVTV
jgi:hypothetical protein